MSSGSAIISTRDFRLVELSSEGKVSELVPKGKAGGRIYASSDERYLALEIPLVFAEEDLIGASGICVYDLSTGKATLLVDDESQYVVLLGWLDDKILYHEVAKEPGFTLKLVDLQGQTSVYLSLPEPVYVYDSPKPSPDGRYIVTRKNDADILIIDVASMSTQTVANISLFYWVRDGLQVIENGVERLHKVK